MICLSPFNRKSKALPELPGKHLLCLIARESEYLAGQVFSDEKEGNGF